MFGHDQFHCPWLAFYTIQQTTKLYAYDVSEASPFALLLFGSEPRYVPLTQSVQARDWAMRCAKSSERIYMTGGCLTILTFETKRKGMT